MGHSWIMEDYIQEIRKIAGQLSELETKFEKRNSYWCRTRPRIVQKNKNEKDNWCGNWNWNHDEKNCQESMPRYAL